MSGYPVESAGARGRLGGCEPLLTRLTRASDHPLWGLRARRALCEAPAEGPTGPCSTERAVMAHYLIEVGYTPQSWATQIDAQANAADRITPALKACGAKLECLYYAFGDSDVVGRHRLQDARRRGRLRPRDRLKWRAAELQDHAAAQHRPGHKVAQACRRAARLLCATAHRGRHGQGQSAHLTSSHRCGRRGTIRPCT